MSYRFEVAIHLSIEDFEKISKHEVVSNYIGYFNTAYHSDDTVTLYINWYTRHSLSDYELGIIRHALIDVPHILAYIGDDVKGNIYEEVLIANNEYLYDYAPSFEIALKI